MLPESISLYWSERLTRQCTYGYILTDDLGLVISWGGALRQIGIGPLEAGQSISDQLLFLEGLLPLSEQSIHIPLVEIDPQHTLDIHLFRQSNGYGVLLLDAGLKKRRWKEVQQKANASAFQRQQAERLQAPSSSKSSHDSIENFLKTINTAALLLGPDGKYRLMGSAPEWLLTFFPKLAKGPLDPSPGNFFSFLENFLDEAQEFWAQEQVGSINSGVWIEVDDAGEEHLFDAKAVYTGVSKIILISNATCQITDKQALIQKGRELALGHSVLKRSQSDLQSAHVELENRVGRRTREIERAKQRLEEELAQRRQLEQERTEILLQLQQSQKMEAIGTLAGGIAHDFNNILSAVVGFTELCLFDAPQDSEISSNLQQVLSAAQRAKALIRQILTFSRQAHPETRPVQLRRIIREALKLLRATLPASVEISQDLKSDAYVMADPTQLHQVVMNLCTNAGQAMVTDGGRLEIKLREKEFDLQEAAKYRGIVPGPHLELSITDNGFGMTEEIMARIFDPFFTTKEKGEGTGMGLAVVHGIVKNCKGAISVSSQVGKGTTFSVVVPTVEKVDTPQTVDPSTLPKGTERILFIDDEPMQADLALKILPTLGYRVTAMTDSEQALKAFLEAPDQFDLVITDMYMPKLTGKIIAIEILKARPDIPIILCSGYSVDLVDPEFLDQYYKGHLVKPILIKELADLIRSVLDQHD